MIAPRGQYKPPGSMAFPASTGLAHRLSLKESLELLSNRQEGIERHSGLQRDQWGPVLDAWTADMRTAVGERR